MFADYYDCDVKEWIDNNQEFINQCEPIRIVEGEYFACHEIALKYAQSLSPALELICLKLISKLLSPPPRPQGSILSIRIESYIG